MEAGRVTQSLYSASEARSWSSPRHVSQAGAGVSNVEALHAAIAGPEILRAEGAQLYVVYPDGVGRSRLTHSLIEKKLGTRGTGRNWNTILKLRDLV
jgi:uncharacterized protein (DUF1697 family)